MPVAGRPSPLSESPPALHNPPTRPREVWSRLPFAGQNRKQNPKAKSHAKFKYKDLRNAAKMTSGIDVPIFCVSDFNFGVILTLKIDPGGPRVRKGRPSFLINSLCIFNGFGPRRVPRECQNQPRDRLRKANSFLMHFLAAKLLPQ